MTHTPMLISYKCNNYSFINNVQVCAQIHKNMLFFPCIHTNLMVFIIMSKIQDNMQTDNESGYLPVDWSYQSFCFIRQYVCIQIFFGFRDISQTTQE